MVYFIKFINGIEKTLIITLRYILNQVLIKLHILIKEEFIKKKKVVGLDIVKQIPKNPHISIFNNFFEKNQKYYAKKIFDEIVDILKK